MPPDDAELTHYVITHLGRHNRPNDVIRVVCERTGWPWLDAQRWVEQVQAKHHPEIVRRQNRWLRFIAISTILMGLAFLALRFLALATKGWVGLLYFLPLSDSVQWFYLIVGVAMMTGGLLGLRSLRK
jgi:hypothetical protein